MTSPQSPTSATETTSRLASLVRALLGYAEARAALLQIEAKEAGSKTATIAIALAVVVTALILGWLMALPALVWIIADASGWHWSRVSLAGAGLHLLVTLLGFVFLRLKLSRLKIFEDSIRELQEDRTWLKSQADPAE